MAKDTLSSTLPVFYFAYRYETDLPPSEGLAGELSNPPKFVRAASRTQVFQTPLTVGVDSLIFVTNFCPHQIYLAVTYLYYAQEPQLSNGLLQ